MAGGTRGAGLTLPTVLPVLRGAALALRPMEDGDAAALFAIYGDPLVMRYTEEEPFADLATVGVMLASVRRLLAGGESLEWAIVQADGGDVIGTCGLHSFDTVARSAQVGCLLRRSAWGHGRMSGALRLLMTYACGELGLRRLLADVDPLNERALRMFERLGYRRDDGGLLGIDLGQAPP